VIITDRGKLVYSDITEQGRSAAGLFVFEPELKIGYTATGQLIVNGMTETGQLVNNWTLTETGELVQLLGDQINEVSVPAATIYAEGVEQQVYGQLTIIYARPATIELAAEPPVIEDSLLNRITFPYYDQQSFISMVGPTSPSFAVSAGNDTANAWHAFDKSVQGWQGEIANSNWLVVQSSRPRRIWKISIQPGLSVSESDSLDLAPASVWVYGSNDGVYYNLLERFDEISGYVYGWQTDLILSAPPNQAYSYYKFVFGPNRVGGHTVLIGELGLYQYIPKPDGKPKIRMSKRLSNDVVNLGYAVAPEISASDIGVVLGAKFKDENWEMQLTADVESVTDSFLLDPSGILAYPLSYTLSNVLPLVGTETVQVRYLNRTWGLVLNTHYTLNGGVLTLTALPASVAGSFDKLYLDIQYRITSIDLLQQSSRILPSGNLVLTDEFSIRDSGDIAEQAALYHCFDLSYDLAKPSRYIDYPIGKCRYALEELVGLPVLSDEDIYPLTNPVRFVDENGASLDGKFKVRLAKQAGGVYRATIYTNLPPTDLIICQYTDAQGKYRKEIITLREVFTEVSKSTLLSHIQAGYLDLNEYALENIDGTYRLYAPVVCRIIGDALRQPTEVRLQVHGDIDLQFNESNKATVNIGIASLSEWSPRPYGRLIDEMRDYFPGYYQFVNPHVIDQSSPWLMNLGMPDDYLFEYDIILLPTYGLVDLAPYNESLMRFLNQGGTLFVSVNDVVSFGTENPILDYLFGSLERSGATTLETTGGWFNKRYGISKEAVALLGLDAEESNLLVGSLIPAYLNKRIIEAEFRANGLRLTEGSSADYTLDRATGTFTLINESYVGQSIEYRIRYLPAYGMTVNTPDLQTLIANTMDQTNKTPVLALKEFDNSGKLIFSSSSLLHCALYSEINKELSLKLLTNILMTVTSRKKVHTPVLKYTIYHQSELYPEEIQHYGYRSAIHNDQLVAPRRLAENIGKLVERYTGIAHRGGSYTVTLQERNGNTFGAPQRTFVSGSSTLGYHDPLDVFTTSPLSLPAGDHTSSLDFILSYPALKRHVAIVPRLYYYGGTDILDYLKVKEAPPTTNRSVVEISCSEQYMEQELFKLATHLPPLPGGRDWARTDMIYYEIKLDTTGDMSGEFAQDLDGQVTLFLKDRYTNRYIYSNNGSIIVSHDWLYEPRGNHWVYDDVYLYAVTDHHSLLETSRIYSAANRPSVSESVSIPTYNENECWFPMVRKIDAVIMDDNYIYRYYTPEYEAATWSNGIGIRFNQNESAVYKEPRVIRLARTPLVMLEGEQTERLTYVDEGVYKASCGNWDTSSTAFNGYPFQVSVNGLLKSAASYYADPVLGYIVFYDEHIPIPGSEVHLSYAYKNYRLQRNIYQNPILDTSYLNVVNSRVLALPSYLNKKVLANPSPVVEKSTGRGQWEIINPEQYVLQLDAGLVLFNQPIEGTFRLKYSYNQIEDLQIKSINPVNGTVELTQPVHFTDTILATYYSRDYAYEYEGYQAESHFELLDLNPTFGHECLVSGERVQTNTLIGRELFLYVLPHEVYDRATGAKVKRGYMLDKTNVSTVRHTWNAYEYRALADEYPELQLLARIKITNSKTLYDSDVLDTRSRGGGLVESISTEQLRRMDKRHLSNWDVTPYAGVGYNANGIAIIRLPESILDRFSQERVLEIVKEHLAAGVKPIIRYYEDTRSGLTLTVDTYDLLFADGIMPLGDYPAVIELVEQEELLAEGVEEIEVYLDTSSLETIE